MDKVERAWENRTLIRWYCTYWCNYDCSYCVQEHGRKQTINGNPGHWADNRPVEDWIAAINAVPNLTLYITGGEPMLDRANIRRLLAEIPTTAVKIDTNGSWKPWPVPDCNPWLLVSYHPEQTGPEKFVDRLKALRDEGWNVGVVNIVAKSGCFDTLRDIRARCQIARFVLNVLTVDGRLDSYTSEEQSYLMTIIPPLYLEMRSGGSPMGRPCLHPHVAYRMHPDGAIEVGCHPRQRGSIFGELPERPNSYVPCPRSACSCSEKFTFLKEIGTNVSLIPHIDYVKELLR